jgi:hypothetical protein
MIEITYVGAAPAVDVGTVTVHHGETVSVDEVYARLLVDGGEFTLAGAPAVSEED